MSTVAIRLAETMSRGAPGVAGAAHGWARDFGDLPATGPVPRLWRAGYGVALPGCPHPGVFPVGVPLLDGAHLWVVSDPHLGAEPVNPDNPVPAAELVARDRAREQAREIAESLVETLALRVARMFRPGLVRLHVWDTSRYAGSLPSLYYPMTRAGLMDSYHPENLEDLLAELSGHIKHVNDRLLTGNHTSLAALAAQTRDRTVPWRLAVLLGDGESLSSQLERDLQRVMLDGLACGICVIGLDIPMQPTGAFQVIQWTPEGCRSSMTHEYVDVTPDPPLPAAEVTSCAVAISDEFERLRSQVRDYAELLPPLEQWGTFDSRAGFEIPIAFAEGRPATIRLGDDPVHLLVGAPTGSGKTNVVQSIAGSLAARFGPDQLEMHFLDLKSVGFNQFGPTRRDPTWLPQAKTVGVDIDEDLEFGLAVLRYLADEIRRRAAVFRDHDVVKLEELRNEAPDVVMPRVVVVFDEGHHLFARGGDLAQEAADLLDSVLRKGRFAGIHLIFVDQNVAGIQMFWTRPAILEQFTLRIALPGAKGILTELNDAADALPRYHAVINRESGRPHANQVVRMPDASHGAVAKVQQELHRRNPGQPPTLFDGRQVPDTAELVAAAPPGQVALGQWMDISCGPATVELPPRVGRNIAAISTGGGPALAVLGAATASLVRDHRPGEARFIVAPFAADMDPDLFGAHQVESVQLADYSAFIEKLGMEAFHRLTSADRTPTYVILLGVDSELLESDARKAEQALLRLGPRVGIHVLGWWQSPNRVRDSFSGDASLDDLGVVVALDVQGDLATLFGQMLLDWTPRPDRGLLLDKAYMGTPAVVKVPGVVA